MKQALKKELAEFERLVSEIKADCDKCKMDCRDRLRWLDSQIKELREVRAEFERTLSLLRATHRLNMKLINLIHAPEKTGENRCRSPVKQF